jgi:acyl-CoA synthetase (AMP-forming)/AMP-acid ligase II
VAALLGVFGARACAVPLCSVHTARELRHVLDVTRPRALVTSAAAGATPALDEA